MKLSNSGGRGEEVLAWILRYERDKSRLIASRVVLSLETVVVAITHGMCQGTFALRVSLAMVDANYLLLRN